MGETGARGAAGATGVTRAVSGASAVGAPREAGAVGMAGVAGVAGAMGLRERKKLRMYQDVSNVAITLFLQKGFERVSVAEVAAAAQISKPTLFRYFSSKEDLVLHRFADHEDEAARVVAARASGSPPSTHCGGSSWRGSSGATRSPGSTGTRTSSPFTGCSTEPLRWSRGCTSIWSGPRTPSPRRSAVVSMPGSPPGRSSPCSGSSRRRTGGGSRTASRSRMCGGMPSSRRRARSLGLRSGCPAVCDAAQASSSDHSMTG